jgi:hypothetical protein
MNVAKYPLLSPERWRQPPAIRYKLLKGALFNVFSQWRIPGQQQALTVDSPFIADLLPAKHDTRIKGGTPASPLL